MNEVEHALAQIADIRAQVAASTRFAGYAPEALGGAGALVLLAALAQSLWPAQLMSSPVGYVGYWAAVMLISAGLIAHSAISRSRGLHGRMADMLVAASIRQIAPFFVAQAIIALIICKFAPEVAWLVPGLWVILTGLIGFVVVSNLPRRIVWVAVWYFGCGVGVLLLAGSTASLSPWMMGLPFALGHVLVASIMMKPME